MTLSTQVSKTSFAGNGSTVRFPLPFPFLRDADIKALLKENGVETTLTLGTHYTLSGAGSATGGSLTMLTAPSASQTLVIWRAPDIVQEVDYVENSAFPAETHESALDLLTMICQSLQEQMDRAVLYPVSTAAAEILDSKDYLAATQANRQAALSSEQSALAAQLGAEASAGQAAASAAIALEVAATADGLVKVSGTDTLAQSLSAKLVAGDGLSESLLNPGGVEALRLSLDLTQCPSRKNKLRNGAFRINQRGYASGTALAQGVPATGVGYGHDTWRAGAGGCTYTFTQSAGPTQISITAGSLISKTEDVDIDQAQMVLSWEGTAQARIGVNGAEPSGAYAASPILVTATVGASVAVEFGTGTVGKAQLENGTFPTPFEWEGYDSALRACQRLLPAFGASDMFSGFTITAASATCTVHFSTPSRIPVTGLISPALTIYTGGANSTGIPTLWTGGTHSVALWLTGPSFPYQLPATCYLNAGPCLFTGAEL